LYWGYSYGHRGTLTLSVTPARSITCIFIWSILEIINYTLLGYTRATDFSDPFSTTGYYTFTTTIAAGTGYTFEIYDLDRSITFTNATVTNQDRTSYTFGPDFFSEA
jgi:hypothetical protein